MIYRYCSRTRTYACCSLWSREGSETLWQSSTMVCTSMRLCYFFFFQAEDGIRDYKVTGVQTCALPICLTFLGHLLERGAQVPIAVMTGQTITPELADRLHGYGIAAMFTKPVDISALEIGRASCRERV